MKKNKEWVGVHFSPEECVCRCRKKGCPYGTAAQVIDALPAPLVRWLDYIRRAKGGAVRLSSVCRCWLHPDEEKKIVAGANGGGPHTKPAAADVAIKGMTAAEKRRVRAAVLRLFAQGKIVGVGVARSFIHIDLGHPRPKEVRRPAVWHYFGKGKKAKPMPKPVAEFYASLRLAMEGL